MAYEMIDVLERLRELDKQNPDVHLDAIENTEKMNASVEEAKAKPDFLDMDKDGDKKEPMKKAIKDKKKKMDEAHKVSKSHVEKMVKDGKTMKQMMDMHPEVDKKELEKMVKDVKESLNESITISSDSPEDLPVIAQIMKLAGMEPVTPDMMPDKDNVPMMKPDDNINGSPCGDDYANTPDEDYKGVEDVTTDAGGGINAPKHPQDIRVKDASPYADFEQRLARLAGIENEEVEDEETDEGFANSMGDEREEPTYKGYDKDYAKDVGHATRKTHNIPANSGDNPLEAIEEKLRDAYQAFKEIRETE